MKGRSTGRVIVALLGTAVLVFACASAAQAATKVVTAEQPFNLSTRDQPQRYEVGCPGKLRPLGGGMRATPAVDGAGSGVFPLSFERLGATNGWHITATLLGSGQAHQVTQQVYCANYKGNVEPVETVLGSHVNGGETKSVTATCPGKKKLLSGGYLSSHFFEGGGVYVTESRAASASAWKITATGRGIGGDVNPIAYCYKSKKPLLQEVAGTPATVPGTPVIGGAFVSATATASCPAGRPFAVGGYSTTSPVTALVSDAYFSGNAWTTTATGVFGAGQVTPYAYCLTSKLPVKGHKHKKK